MTENFSWIRRLSQMGTLLTTRLFGVGVGSDSHGNRYFRGRVKDSTGRESRWVLYAGEPEATKVPPEWFAWLHHAANRPPDQDAPRYDWQKPHVPNLTGTDAALLPSGHPINRLHGAQRPQATGDYQRWKPGA